MAASLERQLVYSARGMPLLERLTVVFPDPDPTTTNDIVTCWIDDSSLHSIIDPDTRISSSLSRMLLS